jgi:hypothetical protein
VIRPAFARCASAFAAARLRRDKSARQATEVFATSRHEVLQMCVAVIDRRLVHRSATREGGAKVDYNKRFVLDNRFFSSIIYIWYEGGGLRPPVVKK